METSCKSLAKETVEMHGRGISSGYAPFGANVDDNTDCDINILELPDSILLNIMKYLPFSSIGKMAQVCRQWRCVALDEVLWRQVFLHHYKLPQSTVMPNGAISWRSEFKRLYDRTPVLLAEERREHKDEVLHVSFSHDGTMFATCSKDGYFKVWKSGHPAVLLFAKDMTNSFSWKFTQFSQFNATDTCLLVSGVYIGYGSTSGEIAVFSIPNNFEMQCRVTNKPYDVFGAWYDNEYLLSGTLYWTGILNSVSAVWLSKASQEVDSEMESVSMMLYRFENVNSSSIRLLHVAEVCEKDNDEHLRMQTQMCISENDCPMDPIPQRERVTINKDVWRSSDMPNEHEKLAESNQASANGDKKQHLKGSSFLDRLVMKSITEDEFDTPSGVNHWRSVEKEEDEHDDDDIVWGPHDREVQNEEPMDLSCSIGRNVNCSNSSKSAPAQRETASLPFDKSDECSVEKVSSAVLQVGIVPSVDQEMEENNNNINNISSSITNSRGKTTVESMQKHKTELDDFNSVATQTAPMPRRAVSPRSVGTLDCSSISIESPPKDKLLIYTWGSETYIPHKIGIKRMRWTDFNKGNGDIKTRTPSMLLPDVMENLHNSAGDGRDKPDVTIEMHGHIVGLSLSPGDRYLYVNCRPWPKDYIISDPSDSPPLAEQVEISSIDLLTFEFVGPVLRSHKAFTHSDECFFLNLDVSPNFVVSGAENKKGYLWDRHYGISLYEFPHSKVVNCVAVNPIDDETLVTVSDDHIFKVWRSRNKMRELGIQEMIKETNV